MKRVFTGLFLALTAVATGADLEVIVDVRGAAPIESFLDCNRISSLWGLTNPSMSVDHFEWKTLSFAGIPVISQTRKPSEVQWQYLLRAHGLVDDSGTLIDPLLLSPEVKLSVVGYDALRKFAEERLFGYYLENGIVYHENPDYLYRQRVTPNSSYDASLWYEAMPDDNPHEVTQMNLYSKNGADRLRSQVIHGQNAQIDGATMSGLRINMSGIARFLNFDWNHAIQPHVHPATTIIATLATGGSQRAFTLFQHPLNEIDMKAARNISGRLPADVIYTMEVVTFEVTYSISFKAGQALDQR